jgi:predicted DNA-binding transcriptional regulator AlpA
VNKSDLIVLLASQPDGDIPPEKIMELAGAKNHDESVLMTAAESCAFLRISRTSLWRHFPPTMRIGSLPRWSKSDLLKRGAK